MGGQDKSLVVDGAADLNFPHSLSQTSYRQPSSCLKLHKHLQRINVNMYKSLHFTIQHLQALQQSGTLPGHILAVPGPIITFSPPYKLIFCFWESWVTDQMKYHPAFMESPSSIAAQPMERYCHPAFQQSDERQKLLHFYSLFSGVFLISSLF